MVKIKEYDDVSADFGATAAGYGGVAQMDPMEQYVQQLIAQGYPGDCTGLCCPICWTFPAAAIGKLLTRRRARSKPIDL